MKYRLIALALCLLLAGCAPATGEPAQDRAPAEQPHSEQISGIVTAVTAGDKPVFTLESTRWGVRQYAADENTDWYRHYADTGETEPADSSLLQTGAQLVLNAQLGGDRTEYPVAVATLMTQRGQTGGGPEPFSYAAVQAQYPASTPGVRTGDFVNSQPAEAPVDHMQAAIDRAEAECTVAHNAATVYRDREADLWAVCFHAGTPGGSQTVYQDSAGVTLLVVSGE